MDASLEATLDYGGFVIEGSFSLESDDLDIANRNISSVEVYKNHMEC